MTNIDEAVFGHYPFNLTRELAPDPASAVSIDFPELDLAISRLPGRQGIYLMDRYLRGMDIPEIAAKHHVGKDTVTEDLRDAIGALKRTGTVSRILLHPDGLDALGKARSTPLEEIGLSVRAYNCLKRAGKDTVEQLDCMELERLLAVHSIGRRTADDILCKLAPRQIFLCCRDPEKAAMFPLRRFRFEEGKPPETYADYVARTRGPDKELAEAILDAENNGLLAVTENTGDTIETDDFQLDKIVSYRMVPPDETWYGNRIRYVSKAARDMAGHLRSKLVSLLLSLEPAMTRTLRGIYLVAAAEDLDVLNAMTGTEPCELPECIDPDDPDACLGCHWNTESSIVLDLKAISRAAQESVDEAEAEGLYVDFGREFDIGVYTTLTHEVFHLAAADPFMELEDSEDAAEKYGIETYENWDFA